MTRATLTRLFIGVCALTLACSSGSNGGTQRDGGMAMGVVPADLRDVERAGEGLVSTTFGEFPARSPAWDRALTVEGILKMVWGRFKTANPTAPAAQVMAVDAAIAKLDTAIAAKDQASATQAANAVGLAMPELFDFFHPDAPKEVIRMDAVFRQVGIDAHFMRFKETAADIASLKTDWKNAMAPVGTRAPTCHRVGGTATVASDIDSSLANMGMALSAMDVTTLERESENGALEVDTLELLFDCPPDNVAPQHGLGAKCTGQSQCGAGQVCDTTNGGGKCAPDPANKIGTPCMSTIDCGTDPRSACNTAAGDRYPGGYCFMEPCDDVQVCPPGATCVSIGGETPGCFKSCTLDADCRETDGYFCQLFSTRPPNGFGPSDHACTFTKCTRDADCQPPACNSATMNCLTCDVGTGKCKP